MPEFLRNPFKNSTEPGLHHELLAEEAQKTGDDTRLVAETIVKWSWDVYAQKPFVASPDELIEHHVLAGYKPVSALSQDEKKNMSPRQLFICEALEGIQQTWQLDARMGHALREFSETGVLPQATGSSPGASPS